MPEHTGSKIDEETFDRSILDWLQETARGRDEKSCLIRYEPGTKEPFCVIAMDREQKRWRFIRGSYLRLALERAFDVHFQAEKE